MKYTRPIIICALLITGMGMLMLPTPSFAQEKSATSSACLNDIYQSFGRETRIYRSVLFGLKKAADVPLGTVRFSREGDAWMKTAPNTWKSYAKGFQSTTWSDMLMDQQTEREVSAKDKIAKRDIPASDPFRRGIFEKKQLLTSEIVPELIQSIRALQCRLRAQCEVASVSQSKNPGEKVYIQPDGCLEFEYTTFAGCRSAYNPTDITAGGAVFDPALVQRQCLKANTDLLAREMDLLKLVVAYDAGYRSLLQFAGVFEKFIVELRFPLLNPLWDASKMIGQFNRIPCFLAQCNE